MEEERGYERKLTHTFDMNLVTTLKLVENTMMTQYELELAELHPKTKITGKPEGWFFLFFFIFCFLFWFSIFDQ